MAPGVWRRDSLPWPHAAPSRWVSAAGVRWHLQIQGKGPVMLLVHGAGASTHSWRRLFPLLAQDFTVVAVDLPGHGLSSRPAISAGMSLPGMASALDALLESLELRPQVAVGHSAGAAIIVAMCLWGRLSPALVIALNGALLPLPGLRGMFFSPLAKITAASGLLPRLCAWRASDTRAMQRLIAGTGSHLDAEGVALYQKLATHPPHVAATLDMMARWDLSRFVRDLPGLAPRMILPCCHARQPRWRRYCAAPRFITSKAWAISPMRKIRRASCASSGASACATACWRTAEITEITGIRRCCPLA